MLGGTLSTSPAWLTTIICKQNQKYSSRAHSGQNMAPVLFLTIYHDTVPLKVLNHATRTLP